MDLIRFYFVFTSVFVSGISPIYGFPRIIGGTETTIEQRPYQAALIYYWPTRIGLLCGGSILSSKYILTAAHCDPGENIPILYARVGSTYCREGGQVLKVKSFVKHPDYMVDILDNDFAIVSFENDEEIQFGDNVRPIMLAQNQNLDDGAMLTVSGWGITADGMNVASETLKEVDLPLVNRNVCMQLYSFMTDRQLCLGGTHIGGTGACFGDSGGPAVYNGMQYGVVSGVYKGAGCATANVPGIYAMVSSARDWILNLTN